MKNRLLIAASVPALLIAAGASAQEADLTFANNIDTSVVTDVTYTNDVLLTGTVELDGDVVVDSSAVATNDVKQLQGPAEVLYREENELNGENGYVSSVFGPGWSEAGNDPNDNDNNGTLEGSIRAGYFAPIINSVTNVAVDGSGNVGLNTAAGYYNMQLNSAALAVSDDGAEDAEGGWAHASTTSLQSLLGTVHMGLPENVLDEDEPGRGGGGNNFRDRNTLAVFDVAGAGNIGLNAAAGAFNQQSNLMTLAVANNSDLAEASTGLVQFAAGNITEQQDSINAIDAVTVGGAGNIGVNMAAGVGNQQLNALTIASSTATAPANGNGNGNGGNDGS